MSGKHFRHAFTLIELLVVLAIISILAAILFPVFASVRERARSVACLSNGKQIGMGVQMYVQDADERLFFRSGWANSRSGPTLGGNPSRWWNQLMPYMKSEAVFTCPSDAGPTDSFNAAGAPGPNGKGTIRRSYIAVCPAESLALAQIDDPQETLVVTEKWDRDWTGSRGDSWIEPFNGDFTTDSRNPSRMFTAANRHQGLVNATLFDGHVKALHASDIQASKDLTGCNLIYRNPFGGTNPPSISSASGQAGQPNICSTFTY